MAILKAKVGENTMITVLAQELFREKRGNLKGKFIFFCHFFNNLCADHALAEAKQRVNLRVK